MAFSCDATGELRRPRHCDRRRERATVAFPPLYDETIERNRPGADQRQPHEEDEVAPLLEADQRREAADVTALGSENRDHHREPERQSDQACPEAEEDRQASKEFRGGGQPRVEPWRRDVQRREKIGDVWEGVQL